MDIVAMERRRTGDQRERDWSELPSVLLVSILNLLPFDDGIRFAAVCTAWLSATKEKLHRPAPQTPWLMYAGVFHWGKYFTPLVDRRAYYIPLTIHDVSHSSFVVVGSSKGWLITFDIDRNFHMLNPISKARIDLPRLPRHIPSRNCIPMHRRSDFPAKAIVVPSNDGGYTVAVLVTMRAILTMRFWPYILIGEAGEDEWRTVFQPTLSRLSRLCDIMYHNDLLYAISEDGIVGAWDMCGIKQFQSPCKLGTYMPSALKFYLAQLSGELIAVGRGSDTVSIFKVDSAGEWSEVASLGKFSLFLGTNESMSFSAVDFPELKKNCVYFAHDRAFSYNDDGPVPHLHPMGIFNLEDGKVEPYEAPLSGGYCDRIPPIWVMPKI